MAIEVVKIVFTGGSGVLGSAFKKVLPDINYPSSSEFNVTHYDQMDQYLKKKDVKLLIHAAALTSPPKADQDPLKALEVNVIGTANIVRLCVTHRIKLIYISTDYVFKGDQGNYYEDDPVYPVNQYAWSKLGGECAVRMHADSLIIRTTFGPDIFPYEKAFTDQWTSRESASVVARKIVDLLDKDITGIIHLGGTRKTVFEYAQSLDTSRDIKPMSVRDVHFKVPIDTSLNCEKYNRIMGKG